MTELLTWSLSVYGLTIIVNRGQIFERVRGCFPKPEGTAPFFGTLLRCTLCFGWWAGALHHVAGFRVIPMNGGLVTLAVATFFSGCAGAGAAWVLFLICEALGQSAFLDTD